MTDSNDTEVDFFSALREKFIEVYFNGSLENIDYSQGTTASLPVYRVIGMCLYFLFKSSIDKGRRQNSLAGTDSQ